MEKLDKGSLVASCLGSLGAANNKNMKNNWERNGFKDAEESRKYMIAMLYRDRVKLLDKGNGGSWNGKANKHGEIKELRYITFFMGTRQFWLDDKGFTDGANVG